MIYAFAKKSYQEKSAAVASVKPAMHFSLDDDDDAVDDESF